MVVARVGVQVAVEVKVAAPAAEPQQLALATCTFRMWKALRVLAQLWRERWVLSLLLMDTYFLLRPTSDDLGPPPKGLS